jgi:hypothetical protein
MWIERSALKYLIVTRIEIYNNSSKYPVYVIGSKDSSYYT